jgi:hypothetical protein
MLFIVIIVDAAAVMVALQLKVEGGDGVVIGKVVVGPLCPVEYANQTCGNKIDFSTYSLAFAAICPGSWYCPPLVRTVTLSLNGTFSIVLPAGQYRVTMQPCGWIGCAYSLPAYVTVYHGGSTDLNISIDTGIR